MAAGAGRISRQFDEAMYGVQRVAKDVASPLQSSEQIADHGESAVANIGEQDSGAACGKHATLNFGDLQTGIHLLVKSHKVSGLLQVVYAFSEAAIRH